MNKIFIKKDLFFHYTKKSLINKKFKNIYKEEVQHSTNLLPFFSSKKQFLQRFTSSFPDR